MRGKPITYLNSSSLRIRTRGRLPHWELDNALYFFTYRLNDALPAAVVQSLAAERAQMERLLTGGNRCPTAAEADEISQMFCIKLDEYLDDGYGECWLRDPRIAQLVIETWKKWDGTRYELIAWCVMPNHVHVVFRLFEGKMLERVVHSWKSFTGSRANEIVGRTGSFWQREYHDRIIRHGRELADRIRYVVNNPSKAGLKDWPYVWSSGEL